MEIKPIARVKSPSKLNNYSLREGNGFSLTEIKRAGKSIQLLKDLNIKIDYLRKSTHDLNVEKLKSLKGLEKKTEKKKPFVKKEKKKRSFKPEPPKKKRKKPTTQAIQKKKITLKPKEPIAKTEEVKKLKKEDIKIDIKEAQQPSLKTSDKKDTKGGTSLTVLTGLGFTTAKKLESIGVNTLEELVKKNPEELANLIKGASAVRMSTWIKEAEQILKQ